MSQDDGRILGGRDLRALVFVMGSCYRLTSGGPHTRPVIHKRVSHLVTIQNDDERKQ